MRQSFRRDATRFAALGDEAVGAPRDRPPRLLFGAHHHQDEHTCRVEFIDQFAVTAERHHGRVDAGADTDRNLAAPQKRGEQVDGDGAIGREITDPPDGFAQFVWGRQAQRAQAARAGDSGSEIGPRQPATHAGLADRNVQAQPVKQVHGPVVQEAMGQ